MRMRLPALVLAAAVLAPFAAAADVTPGCQRAVASAGAKFARVALKLGQRCAMHATDPATCRPRAGTPAGNAALNAQIGRAVGRLATHVSTACAASDLSAYARRCPDPTGPPLSLAELVACLRDTHLDRVGAMLAVEFPSLAAAPAAAAGCTANQACQCTCSASGAFLAGDGQ